MEKILNDVQRDAHAKLKGQNGGIEELADAINTILQFLRMARRHGLLCLEDFVEDTRSEYLR